MKWSIPERIVEQGREYMQEGRVLSIVQNPEKRIWLSEVLGKNFILLNWMVPPKNKMFVNVNIGWNMAIASIQWQLNWH